MLVCGASQTVSDKKEGSLTVLARIIALSVTVDPRAEHDLQSFTSRYIYIIILGHDGCVIRFYYVKASYFLSFLVEEFLITRMSIVLTVISTRTYGCSLWFL